MNREIGTILRLLVFIGIGLVFLIFLNLNNGPSINIINVNFYPNAPLNHQQIQSNNKKCHRIFTEMQKFHSTFGRTQPRKLEETKEIFNNKDNNMPVSKEWLLDQEFKALINQPVEFTVTNKEINAKIERIVNKLEYNSFADFNIEKVLWENVAADELKNAKIGVLGLYELTYDPWLESLLYLTSNSTARISLLDHQNRKYENAAHFKWSHISDVLRRNEAELFDILVDYHVSERLGLGRYGEEMSLNADSDTVELAHCLLKPGGLLVLSVSLAREADELASYGHVVYNVGRMYGEKRLQRMIDGWTVRSESVFRYGTVKVYVLQKN